MLMLSPMPETVRRSAFRARDDSLEFPRETLRRAQRGDLRAFEKFVEAFERLVHHTAYRLLSRRLRSQLEDVIQDIFLKLFRMLPRFDPHRGTKLSTWVLTLVKNHCFDELKRKRLPQVSLHADGGEGPAQDLAASEQGPAEETESRELAARIDEAVQQLSADQRASFILREYQGLSYQEIASVMATTEGTVKSRIHRAKESLRVSLQHLI